MKRIIGSCAVDSGGLIIVDPCYLASWKDGEPDRLDNHYGKYGAITDGANRGGEILVSGIGGKGVAFTTGYGDGNYPVEATYGANNIIKKITIKFV